MRHEENLSYKRFSFLTFVIFPAICKNKLPPKKKLPQTLFPQKIYSRVNILLLKFAEQNTVLRIHASSMTT